MPFLSLWFYAAVIILLVLYYAVPVKARWGILLAGSLGFYCCISGRGIFALLFSVLVGFGTGLFLKRVKRKRILLAAGIGAVLLPYLSGRFLYVGKQSILQAVGISYFTLQIIAYMADVYRGEVQPERNPAKFALFVTFFPQIVQGPIPRYGQLGRQFFENVVFKEDKFTRGFQWILWGFFLKLMIADRAGIVVDRIFDNWEIYTGSYVLLGGVLYSIQLYADFMACVYMAKGLALLFGIELMDNFRRPYFSGSIREFWGRWHISLSSWLRDYIYIPLGGNRKGKFRKWLNLLMVFLVSGIWHGVGLKYIAWGLLHAVYQIAGDITGGIRERLYRLFKIESNSFLAAILKKGTTFFLAMLAWVVFRAASLKAGLKMLWSLFTVYNPWVLLNDSVFELGLDLKECMLLLLAILLLFAVSFQGRKEAVGNWLLKQHLILRWTVYIGGILMIVVYGTYGTGFDARNFIYGSF